MPDGAVTTKPKVQQKSTPTGAPPDVLDGGALQDPLSQQEQLDLGGQLNWQQAIGERIGGEAWKALSKELSEAKLIGHVEKLVDGGLDNLLGQLESAAGVPEAKLLSDALRQGIEPKLDKVASDIIKGDNGLAVKLKSFAANNPKTLVIAALVGGIGYLLSNPKLPKLQQAFKIGKGKLKATLETDAKLFDLAKIKDITITKLGATYAWGDSEVSLEYGEGDDGQYGQAGFKTKVGNGELSGGGKYTTGPNGQKVEGNLGYKSKNFSANASGMMDDKGGHAFNANANAKFNDHLSGTLSLKDISAANAMGGYDHTQGIKAGLKYQKNNFSLEGNVGLDRINGGNVQPSVGIGAKWSF